VTSSFAAKYPAGVGLWHPTRNGGLTPASVLAGASVQVWWLCPVAEDHEWQAAPVVLGAASISKGNTGCPFCRGFRPSVTNNVAAYPELAAEWHPTRNGELTTKSAVASTTRKYWWRCRTSPKHEWEASGSNRVRGRCCPFCKKSFRSILEVGLAYELREFFPDLDLSDDKVVLDGVVTQVDLLVRSRNLVVEVDGRFYHSQSRYPVRDRVKSQLLTDAGFRLLRIREAPLERITEADVLMPAAPTIKQTADAALSRIAELGWSPVPGLAAYLAETEPRHLSEAMAHIQKERPGQRLRLPGPVIMPKETRWRRGYRLVEQFVSREGHARVPDSHVEDDLALGTWVSMQRQRYTRGKLEPERVARLESLSGWIWSAAEEQWEEGLIHLVTFLKREGHIRVPAEHRESDGFPLGSWVRSHRRRGGRRALTVDQRQRLEAIPSWTYKAPMESTWERGVAAMDAVARREGHCRIPAEHREDGVELDSWCARQRGLYHLGRLPVDRVSQLEAIPGWSWRPREAAWERGYDALVAISVVEGSAAIRLDSDWDGYPVGAWVGEQRNRRSDLPDVLRLQLEALPGWSWSVNSDSWDRHLQALDGFAKREGHAAVPTGHLELGLPLGSWVIRNRAEYRQGKLADARAAQLEGFAGWLWDPLAEKWEAHYEELVAYVGREGHARVPMSETSAGMALGQWVVAQRQGQKKGGLDIGRAERLAGLAGWAWDANEAAWEDGLDHLVRYKQRTGHCVVPSGWLEDEFRLGQWLTTQRSWKKSGRLRLDREHRLAELVGQT